MNVTHRLQISHRDHDNLNFQCLCTREHGITMIFAMLRSRKEERFLVHLRELFSGIEEDLKVLSKDGPYYYYTDKI